MIVAGLNGLNVNTASDGLGIPENLWGMTWRISRKSKKQPSDPEWGPGNFT